MYSIKCTECGQQVDAPVFPAKWRHRTMTTPCRCETNWVFVYDDHGKCVGYHRSAA
jgi:hypothetical protein